MWVKIQKRTAPSSRSQAAFTMRTLPSVKIANSIRYTQILIIDYQSSSARKSTRNKDLSTFKNSSNNGWILLHWQVLQDLNKPWNYVSNMKYVADILFLHAVSSLTLSITNLVCSTTFGTLEGFKDHLPCSAYWDYVWRTYDSQLGSRSRSNLIWLYFKTLNSFNTFYTGPPLFP